MLVLADCEVEGLHVVTVFVRVVDRDILTLLGPWIMLEVVLVGREVEGSCVVPVFNDRGVGRTTLLGIAEVEVPFRPSRGLCGPNIGPKGLYSYPVRKASCSRPYLQHRTKALS